MFNSTFNIDHIANITEGSRVASFAHLLNPAGDVPPVRNTVASVMPLRLARAHVGGASPGCFCWRDEDLRVVAIAGAREPADQRAVISGWNDPVAIEGLDGLFNKSAADWAASVATFLAPELAAVALPTWFYGYSWGGGACTILAKKLQQAFVGSHAWAVSFGSPRFCDFNATAQFRNVILARIFVRDDPVAILPPTFEQAPFAHVAIGVRASMNWRIWRFTERGYALDALGILTPRLEPDSVPYPIDLNLYDFIRQSTGEGRPHNIINYRSILETNYPEASDMVTDPNFDVEELAGGHSTMEPRGHLPTKSHIQRQARSIIHSRTTEAPSNERAAARRANRKIIRIVKDVTGWSVFIGQDRVYEATSKRDARGVANALRALSIQLGQQPDLWTAENVIELLRFYQAQ